MATAPVAVLGTLLCCAVPILLVAAGAGAAVAAAVAAAPWLADLSRHKVWVFVAAALMLAADYWILYRARAAACRPGGVCHASHPYGRWMRRVFWAAVALYVLGASAAYLTLPVVRWIEGWGA